MSEVKIIKSTKRVYQVIDLKEVFGVNLKGFGGIKEAIAQGLIDAMKDRIGEGLDVNMNPMRKYSSEYKESPEFIAAGKDDTVNMKLTGDMLGSIDIIKQSGNKVTIGFSDREQELKAYRHIVGDSVPVRNFFGISGHEIDKVKKEFDDELDSIKESNVKEDTYDSTRGKFISLDVLRKEVLSGGTFVNIETESGQ